LTQSTISYAFNASTSLLLYVSRALACCPYYTPGGFVVVGAITIIFFRVVLHFFFFFVVIIVIIIIISAAVGYFSRTIFYSCPSGVARPRTSSRYTEF
jgi:hypothetical protein